MICNYEIMIIVFVYGENRFLYLSEGLFYCYCFWIFFNYIVNWGFIVWVLIFNYIFLFKVKKKKREEIKKKNKYWIW